MAGKEGSRLVHGVGYNDGVYATSNKNSGGQLKEYTLWTSMLKRCTPKFWSIQQNYKGTSCSENFKHYSFFYEWCQEQVGFKNIDDGGRRWALDKDILVKGNKIYSESACVFVPQRLNQLLVKREAERGKYPIGVHLDKQTGRYASQISIGRNMKNLGLCSTEQEAFERYKVFKESIIKNVAKDYKHQLDSRVYKALMNYAVEITD